MEYNPSPKKARKIKSKKKGKTARSDQTEHSAASASQPPHHSAESDDDNTVENLLEHADIEGKLESSGGAAQISQSAKPTFGTEATNSPTKRRSIEEASSERDVYSSPKRSRKCELPGEEGETWPSAPLAAAIE